MPKQPTPTPDTEKTRRPDEPPNVTAPPEPGIPQPPETLNPEWPWPTPDLDENAEKSDTR